MGLVQQVLVVGVGVHGVQQPLANAHRLVQHLGQRCQAVGGTGSIGDHLLVAQQLVVDAIDHGQVGAIQRMRGEHPARTGLQVLLDQGALLELAGAFEHHVDAQLAPRQPARLALGEQADALTADDHRLALQLHRLRKATECRIEARQMHQRAVFAEIVDGNDPHLLLQAALEQGPHDRATDSSIPVDSNTQHARFPAG